MQKTFQLYRMADTQKTPVATVTIDAANVLGAEENLVVLNDVGLPVAVLNLQPGIDRKEVSQG